MDQKVQTVVIVGGGTAGWLSAAWIAARRPDLSVTLVEAPDIPTIGVGEGTWPTMRETLATIGIDESDFLVSCDAAFKQGSRFDGWVDGGPGDSYLHPFTAPPPGDAADLVAAWQSSGGSFAAAMTAQAATCAAGLAPRQRAMPPYAAALNYGYHLDAGKFAARLARHATQALGVTRIATEVTGIDDDADGWIAALHLKGGDRIAGDLFIDCSGMAALVIGRHCGTAWLDRGDVSFNDRALAVQVPTDPAGAIASQTVGTAHGAGWLWDIALPGRRGIGCVYASRFMSDDEAEGVLARYVADAVPGADAGALSPRRLAFRTGHRASFWQRNCLAIGLSAGFIEPLEASAIMLIEMSLRALTDSFPTTRATMPVHAARFDEAFLYRWDRIVEFLKLHYLLSRREEPYWRAQRDPASVPPRLLDQLSIWRERPPTSWDLPRVDELFSAASQQYVLYGMGFAAPAGLGAPSAAAMARLDEVAARGRALTAALPSNRAYLGAVAAAAA